MDTEVKSAVGQAVVTKLSKCGDAIILNLKWTARQELAKLNSKDPRPYEADLQESSEGQHQLDSTNTMRLKIETINSVRHCKCF